MVVAGCACRAPAQIPYDLGQVATRPAPQHALRVAILPLEDARDVAEAPDDRGLYVYNGLSYAGTRLEALGPDPHLRLTELLAQHLARARVFSQVILVLRAEQAPEADLILSGKIRRARGYVEAEAPAKASGRAADSRHVLAEVVLEDLELRAVGEGPRLVFDAGWSIAEARTLDAEGGAPDPWAVLSEALRVALDDLTQGMLAADLSGAVQVPAQVELSGPVATSSLAAPFFGLHEAPPEGWGLVRTSSAAAPDGWLGPAGCEGLRLEARQLQRFSRVLGPYTPAVDLWACPDSVPLRFSGRADHPARLLGRREGRWYLSLALGRTNWPQAEAQIAHYLALTPPPTRYIFEIGPGARAAPQARSTSGRSLRPSLRSKVKTSPQTP